MSQLLEVFGRGLIAQMVGAFASALGADRDESLEDVQRIAEANPDDVEIQTRLGGRYLRAEDAVAAREIFLAVLARDNRNLPARLGLACAFDALNQLEVALEQLRIAQKADPTNPAILFCLGYCHERRGVENQAISYYQDALNACPTLRNAHERLAAIYLKNDETDLAIHHYVRLCELDPHEMDLHLTLAALLMKSGDHDAAIQSYEHALALEPDNWEAHSDTVSAYEETGLIREAIEHLHKMIDNGADFANTRLRLGDLYARVGDDVAAMAHYKQALVLCPDYLEANVKIATQNLRAGRHDEAAKSFSSALEINDRLLGAYVGIGVCQQSQGRTEEALASLDMARNIEPNSTLLFSEVARMQLKAAASAEADAYLCAGPAKKESTDSHHLPDLISRQIARIRQTIVERPNHADLHYRLGLLLRNRGQIEEAIEAFRRAVAINPCYMKALIKLGLALKEIGQTDEAIDVFRQATRIEGNYADLHYQLGLLFAQRCQFEMAVEHYEAAVRSNAQNIDFQANLALALQSLGLIDRAGATWQVVCDLAPESAYAQQARAAIAKNRQAE